MTTRKELFDLTYFEEYSENASICSLRTAITEAKFDFESAKSQIKSSINLIHNSFHGPDLLAAAAKHDIALGKLDTLFMTLACVLQGLGEEINY